jgi:DNA uptake protein ComE-like DNA-binding protein
LHDVYELTSKEIKRIKAKFEIKTIPTIQKINLNFATKSELASLVYINTYLATNILEERLLRGGFKNLDELKYVQDFPLDRLENIKLYLTIN